MITRYDTFSTPLGLFSVAVDNGGAVVAAAFGDADALSGRFSANQLQRDPEALAAVGQQLTEYFAGKRTDFSLRYTPAGTPFQQKVWNALLKIPYGQTQSYAQLASATGLTRNASRAVGTANGANPICLFIPCHRVIGSDGSLTGYAFGCDIKRALLKLEGAILA